MSDKPSAYLYDNGDVYNPHVEIHINDPQADVPEIKVPIDNHLEFAIVYMAGLECMGHRDKLLIYDMLSNYYDPSHPKPTYDCGNPLCPDGNEHEYTGEVQPDPTGPEPLWVHDLPKSVYEVRDVGPWLEVAINRWTGKLTTYMDDELVQQIGAVCIQIIEQEIIGKYRERVAETVMRVVMPVLPTSTDN